MRRLTRAALVLFLASVWIGCPDKPRGRQPTEGEYTPTLSPLPTLTTETPGPTEPMATSPTPESSPTPEGSPSVSPIEETPTPGGDESPANTATPAESPSPATATLEPTFTPNTPTLGPDNTPESPSPVPSSTPSSPSPEPSLFPDSPSPEPSGIPATQTPEASPTQGTATPEIEPTQGTTAPTPEETPSSTVTPSPDTPEPGWLSYPAALDFGEVVVGDVVEQSFLVTNESESDLQLLGLELVNGETGDGANLFQLETSAEVGDVFPVGESIEISVLFYSLQIGSSYGVILLATDDETEPEISIFLLAEATRPEISVEPTFVDFGEYDVGYATQTTLLVSNVGVGGLTIRDVFTDGLSSEEFILMLPSDFEIGDVLEPGYPLEMSLVFYPQDEGPDSGTLTFLSNDPETPELIVPVSGIGIPHVEIQVEIIQPAGGDTVEAGAEVEMVAEVTDFRDTLENLHAYWDSSTDGILCYTVDVIKDVEGGTLSCTAALTTPGTQSLRLFVMDDYSRLGTDLTNVVVVEAQEATSNPEATSSPEATSNPDSTRMPDASPKSGQ